MKIKDIALSAAYVGQRVVKAICVGAQEIWSAVKYILFKDKVVEQICATNWGDGVGITEEQAAAVTDIGTIFKGNTEIASFNELEKFTGLSYFGSGNETAAPFMDCSNLESVSMPNHIASIGSGSFKNCTSLQGVGLPSSLTEIKLNAFYGCTSLKSISLPYNDISVGENAFNQCKNLTNINLHDKIIELSNNAFRDSALEGIINLFNLRTVKLYLTFANTNISSVESLGSSVQELNGNALGGVFSGCKKLTHVNLPLSVVIIGVRTFYENLNLENVNIAENVKTLGDRAFYGCSKLVQDMYLPNVDSFVNDGGEACFMNSGITGIYAPKLPFIPGSFCRNCTDMTGELDFPNVTNVGAAAFMNTALTKIKNLGQATSLVSGGVYGAFLGCKQLTFAELPSTLASIGQYCFQDCLSLETVIMNAVAPPSIEAGIFLRTPSTMSIYVPDQSVQAYREASGWLSYADRIKPLSEYVES